MRSRHAGGPAVSNKRHTKLSHKRDQDRFSYVILGVVFFFILLVQSFMKPIDYSVDDDLPVKRPPKIKRRLEFIHIPKTGGTAIESIAKNANITWGICHFARPEFVFKVSDGTVSCAPANERDVKNWEKLHFWKEKGVSWWHTPPAHVSRFYDGSDPFAGDDVDMFAVVRNPYTRMISEYKHTMGVKEHLKDKELSEEHFNEFLKNKLTPFKKNMFPGNLKKGKPGNRFYYGNGNNGHLIPQYDFVYNRDKKEKVIEHVIRYENLQAEFSKLMAEYNIPLELPKEHVRPKAYLVERKIDIQNISLSNMHLIENIYKDDFRAFGYEIVSSKKEGN